MIRPNVLLVDGSCHIRDVMLRYLERENFCVVSAATAADGFHEIVRKDFDVLIIDLRLGRTQEGLRLVTAIRHLQPEALIVAVSDSLDVQQAMKAIRLKVDVIVKPLDVREVAELIKAKCKATELFPITSSGKLMAKGVRRARWN
jgi:DNA-binding NtrC family response regulator